MSATLGTLLRKLEKEPENTQLLYFAALAAFHEDMHGEAFHYTRQTLGYEDPFEPAKAAEPASGPVGDLKFEGGRFMLGAAPEDGFVFDNEKWAHEVTVAPFGIARTAVTNAEFAAFADAGGYGRREFWSLDFQVSPATLIPRPDSETLIEAALAAFANRPPPHTIIDLGTGTGCLLLALLTEFPSAFGIGLDLVPDAANRLAYQFLVNEGAVHVCGIQKIHAQFDGAPDRCDRLGVVTAAIEFRHAHAAQAQG